MRNPSFIIIGEIPLQVLAMVVRMRNAIGFSVQFDAEFPGDEEVRHSILLRKKRKPKTLNQFQFPVNFSELGTAVTKLDLSWCCLTGLMIRFLSHSCKT